jgi:hypothetical protein
MRETVQTETENKARPIGVGVEPIVLWVVQLYDGVWIAPWSGDPGRTTKKENAKRFGALHGARVRIVPCDHCGDPNCHWLMHGCQ